MPGPGATTSRTPAGPAASGVRVVDEVIASRTRRTCAWVVDASGYGVAWAIEVAEVRPVSWFWGIHAGWFVLLLVLEATTTRTPGRLASGLAVWRWPGGGRIGLVAAARRRLWWLVGLATVLSTSLGIVAAVVRRYGPPPAGDGRLRHDVATGTAVVRVRRATAEGGWPRHPGA